MEAKLRYRKELKSNGIKSTIKKIPQRQTIKTPRENSSYQTINTQPNSPQNETLEKGPRLGMGKKPTKNEPRINFVQRNIQSASQQKSRAKPDKPKGMKERIVNSKHAPGEIPKYLEQRKDEIKAKNAPPPDVKCPKGMRLLSDEEKQEAVLSLQQRKQEIEATLAKAPLRIESPQLLRNERQLRQELSEIESTLRHFKKKYVFVNEDEHF